jgi:hypothetical protein
MPVDATFVVPHTYKVRAIFIACGLTALVSACVLTSDLDGYGAEWGRVDDAGLVADVNPPKDVASSVDAPPEIREVGPDAPPNEPAYLFTAALADESPWTSVLLSSDPQWTGVNAPDLKDIRAVEKLTDFDRLIVATSRAINVRRPEGWQTPLVIASAFPEMASCSIEALDHVPYVFGKRIGAQPPVREGLTFKCGQRAFLYNFTDVDQFRDMSSISLADANDPAPRRLADTTVASFNVFQEQELVTSPNQYLTYVIMSNGRLYVYNNGLVWSNAPLASAIYFRRAGAPALAAIQAAYVDHAAGKLHVIATK